MLNQLNMSGLDESSGNKTATAILRQGVLPSIQRGKDSVVIKPWQIWLGHDAHYNDERGPARVDIFYPGTLPGCGMGVSEI